MDGGGGHKAGKQCWMGEARWRHLRARPGRVLVRGRLHQHQRQPVWSLHLHQHTLTCQFLAMQWILRHIRIGTRWHTCDSSQRHDAQNLHFAAPIRWATTNGECQTDWSHHMAMCKHLERQQRGHSSISGPKSTHHGRSLDNTIGHWMDGIYTFVSSFWAC